LTPEIKRVGAFEGLPAFPATSRVKAVPTGPLARILFRGSPAAAAAVSAVFGASLSTVPMRAGEAGGRAALWLGPDEWLLIGRDGEGEAILAAIAGAVGEPHSAVDVGHRNTGLILSGARAVDVLNAGCPLDLHPSAFPIGMCTRTLLGKAEIVLWRQAADRFHIEGWRSFAPYLLGFLAEAAREYA
jgi:sarcosine oxidase subunit gamma